MVAVAELLRVLHAAPTQAHHGRLCVVEGGALVEKAGGADGALDHVELLELKRCRIPSIVRDYVNKTFPLLLFMNCFS